MQRDLRDYLNGIESLGKREDCFALVKIMEEESGYKARLGGKIVGFGVHRYVHDREREGKAVVTGFLPRARDISIYIMSGFAFLEKELQSLGKHKTAKVCLYISRLSDVDENVLRTVIRKSVHDVQSRFECWGN